MDRYVAFLRGINLGGRRVKNDELRASFSELGFSEVATFRASGNVIFSTRRQKVGSIVALLEAGLEELLGYQVPVFLRSVAEVLGIAAYAPFDLDQIKVSAGKLQVMMLLQAPSEKARKQVLSMRTDQDRLAIRGRELYWLPSAGTMESRLDTKAIDLALGLATTRTKGTIELIAARHFAP
jgi:uncharacterized protein (DUF1697 family)